MAKLLYMSYFVSCDVITLECEKLPFPPKYNPSTASRHGNGYPIFEGSGKRIHLIDKEPKLHEIFDTENKVSEERRGEERRGENILTNSCFVLFCFVLFRFVSFCFVLFSFSDLDLQCFPSWPREPVCHHPACRCVEGQLLHILLKARRQIST